jgi:hypothetical protein
MDVNLQEMLELIESNKKELSSLKLKILEIDKKMDFMKKDELLICSQTISYYKPNYIGNLNNSIDSLKFISTLLKNTIK